MNREYFKLSTLIATFGPFGHMPIAPGTWGSLAAVGLWWLIIAHLSLLFEILILAVIILIGIWTAGISEKSFGHDARQIVIDEVAGQLLVLTVCQSILWQIGVAFVLFRFFDVMKPPPINASQSLPGGFGIVIDDLLAGVYAGIIILIIRFIIND